MDGIAPCVSAKIRMVLYLSAKSLNDEHNKMCVRVRAWFASFSCCVSGSYELCHELFCSPYESVPPFLSVAICIGVRRHVHGGRPGRWTLRVLRADRRSNVQEQGSCWPTHQQPALQRSHGLYHGWHRAQVGFMNGIVINYLTCTKVICTTMSRNTKIVLIEYECTSDPYFLGGGQSGSFLLQGYLQKKKNTTADY